MNHPRLLHLLMNGGHLPGNDPAGRQMIHCVRRHVRFKDLQTKVKLVLGRKSQATARGEPFYEVLIENFGSEKWSQG